MREYEWRRENGSRFTKPKAAINACVFRLQSFATGTVSPLSAADENAWRQAGKSIVHIHVSKTGERVDSTLSADCTRCCLIGHDVWYDVEGRIVPAPKELVVERVESPPVESPHTPEVIPGRVNS